MWHPEPTVRSERGSPLGEIGQKLETTASKTRVMLRGSLAS